MVAPRYLKKTVCFTPIIRYISVSHRDDYTPEEVEAIWCSEAELKIVFQECVTTVRKMVNREPVLLEEGLCSRGLEYKTPSGAKFRRGNKAKATQTVITEQRLQKSMGMEDPEYLAEVFREATKNSRHLAHLMALRDEEESRPLLQSKSSLMMLREKKQRRYSSPTSSPTCVADGCDESLTRGSNEYRCKKIVYFVDDCLNGEPSHAQHGRSSYRGVAA
jgi:hypothetical protein